MLDDVAEVLGHFGNGVARKMGGVAEAWHIGSDAAVGWCEPLDNVPPLALRTAEEVKKEQHGATFCTVCLKWKHGGLDGSVLSLRRCRCTSVLREDVRAEAVFRSGETEARVQPELASRLACGASVPRIRQSA